METESRLYYYVELAGEGNRKLFLGGYEVLLFESSEDHGTTMNVVDTVSCKNKKSDNKGFYQFLRERKHDPHPAPALSSPPSLG